MRRAGSSRQSSMHSSSTSARLGVVGDAGHGRPGQQEVRAERGIDVLGEAGHHARHVLHAVPARDLHDDRRIGRRRRAGLQQVDAAVDPARRSVAARERHVRHLVRRRPAARRSRAIWRTFRCEIGSFLAENGSIDGGITCSLDSVDPGGCEGPAREHERVDVLEVRAQERPGAFGPLVLLVDSDVAAPDDRRAGAADRGG